VIFQVISISASALRPSLRGVNTTKQSILTELLSSTGFDRAGKLFECRCFLARRAPRNDGRRRWNVCSDNPTELLL